MAPKRMINIYIVLLLPCVLNFASIKQVATNYVGGENGLRGAQTYLADDINIFSLIDSIITKLKGNDTIQFSKTVRDKALEKYERLI
jgi:hypothetical protein